VEASDARLLRTEEASLSMEEATDEAPEAASLVMDATPEPMSEVMELTTEPMSEGTPPTAEVTREMMESTWALATPAAMTAVAMVEKRILMVVVGWVWLGG
jgi:hypothetical protein